MTMNMMLKSGLFTMVKMKKNDNLGDKILRTNEAVQ